MEFADLVDAKLDEITLPKNRENKLHKRCRYAGAMEGIFAELECIQNECWQICFMDGDRVGRIEAKAFCDLVIEAEGNVDAEDWLRGPVDVCGLSYQIGCDAAFLAVPVTYENEFGACVEYIKLESWDQSRLKACDYPEDE